MCQQIVCLHARKRKFYRHVSCVRLRQIDCKQEISILRKAERAAHVAVCLRQKRMFPHKLVPRQVTYRGLILVTGTIGIPSSIMLLSSSFRSIPNELLEAAAIDGCGYFRKIFHIMIPMGKPAIAICTIMGFISSWNDLLPPMVIIKSVNKRLVMPALDGLVSMYNADTPFQLTGILIAAVPAIAIYLILSKQIIMGISAGSTK